MEYQRADCMLMKAGRGCGKGEERGKGVYLCVSETRFHTQKLTEGRGEGQLNRDQSVQAFPCRSASLLVWNLFFYTSIFPSHQQFGKKQVFP